MTFGLQVDSNDVPSGLQRVIRTGNTGLSAGSVSVPDFDTSDEGYIISIPTGFSADQIEEYDLNAYTAAFTFNNTTKVLAWSFPTVSANSGFLQQDPGLAPAPVNTKYILVQGGGGHQSDNRDGIEIFDASGSLSVDDRYPTLSVIETRATNLTVSGTPVNFDTTTSGTTTYYFNSTRARQFDAGEWSTVTYDDEVTIPFAAADSANGIKVLPSTQQQHFGAHLASPLAAGSYPLTWGMSSIYNPNQRPVPVEGLALWDSTGNPVWTTSDRSMRVIGENTQTNILDLDVDDDIDITHESTTQPFYYVSSTCARAYKIKTTSNIRQVHLCRPGLERINNTTTRLRWVEYALAETSISAGWSSSIFFNNSSNVTGTVGISAIISAIHEV